MTLSAKMHTGKSSIYLPCLSYETAKVHVISVIKVKCFCTLQSLVNTKDIKLPYFLCFNFLDFFVGLNDTSEVSYISYRNFDDKCRFSVRNSGRILMTYHMLTNVDFLSQNSFKQEFLKNSEDICCFSNRHSWRIPLLSVSILQEFLKNSYDILSTN